MTTPFLPTLLTSVQTNPTKVDLVFSVFGLLSNVALDAKGSTILRGLGADALAVDAIRDHPDSPELHSVAFTLLQNIVNVHEKEQQHTLDLVQLVLQSMEKHIDDEMLQINGCQLLLGVVASSQTPQLCTSVQSLVRSGNGTEVLTLAGEKFPNSCKDLVDGLLQY